MEIHQTVKDGYVWMGSFFIFFFNFQIFYNEYE